MGGLEVQLCIVSLGLGFADQFSSTTGVDGGWCDSCENSCNSSWIQGVLTVQMKKDKEGEEETAVYS